MEAKQKTLSYSSFNSALPVNKFKKLLEEIKKYPCEQAEVFIQIQSSKRRSNTFEKIIYLTTTIKYYKIDVEKKLLYFKLKGLKQAVCKDLQVFKTALIQFN